MDFLQFATFPLRLFGLIMTLPLRLLGIDIDWGLD
jgi:hypothetical protein